MRIGFLGTGWIGRNRMEAMLGTGLVNAAAVCDPNPGMAREAIALAPSVHSACSLGELLAWKPDGLVIATPSAMHAEQCVAAFNAGVAVFCQKPLGRNAAEVAAVMESAARSDRLLGVDLSYRHTAAVQAIRDRIRAGELGKIFAADLTFHNAYGPQSEWFWNRELAGGGCLIDLGVHLVDLALWLLDFPRVLNAHATLMRNGCPAARDEVEDYAVGELTLAGDVSVRLACSWNLNAGEDAAISARFFGTQAGVAMNNVGGSFFDFSADLLRGRNREPLASPPDSWGGRAAIDWLHRLNTGAAFNESTSGLLETATALDRLYASAGHNTVEKPTDAATRPRDGLIQSQDSPGTEKIEPRCMEPSSQAKQRAAPASD